MQGSTPSRRGFQPQVWSDKIEQVFGVRISPEQIYLEHRTGHVMAGSEYIATCPWGDYTPEAAHSWSETLTHMPRFSSVAPMETAHRAPCGCEAECCRRHHKPGGCLGLVGNYRMDWVGPICDSCAARLVKDGAGRYIQPA